MNFIIKGGGSQITLPITPESFKVETARNIQKINIQETGDVNLAGNMALGNIKIDCIFPSRDYPFAKDCGDPYGYVEKIQRLIKKKTPARFIVTDTEVNERVLIESISYGEQDGTGDVYATICMAGYRAAEAVETMTVSAAAPTVKSSAPTRAGEKAVSKVQQYRVKDSDSYMSICRAFYRDRYTTANSYKMGKALAAYNGDGSHIVPSKVQHDDSPERTVNRVIKIPPFEALGME